MGNGSWGLGLGVWPGRAGSDGGCPYASIGGGGAGGTREARGLL